MSHHPPQVKDAKKLERPKCSPIYTFHYPVSALEKRAQSGYWDERRWKRTWNSGLLADTVWAQWWVMMLFTSQLGLHCLIWKTLQIPSDQFATSPFIYLFFLQAGWAFLETNLWLLSLLLRWLSDQHNQACCHRCWACVYFFFLGKNLMIKSLQKLTNESRVWNYFSTFRKSFTLFIQIEKALKISYSVQPSTCCCERGGTVDSSVLLSVSVFVLDRETLRERGKWSGMVGCLVTVTCPGL